MIPFQSVKTLGYEPITVELVLKQSIDAMPTIDVEPTRHEKWICHHEPYTWMGYTYWSCSGCNFECGYDRETYRRTKYCPECGAKMDDHE